MRNLLAGLAALVILLGTLGWFRGWYSVGTLPADTGRFAFRIEVDGARVGGDVMDALRAVHARFSSDKKEKEEDSSKDREKVGQEK